MSTEKEKRHTDDEYETQHFGFSSTEFISQFRIVYINRMNESNSEMEATITRKMNLNDSKKETLHNEILSLTEHQSKKLDEYIYNLEDQLHKFFTIPCNIVLPDDEVQVTINDDESIEDLEKEIENLEKQFKQDKLLTAIYNKELEFLKTLEPVQESVSFVLGNINKVPKISIYEKQKQNHSKMQKIVQKLSKNDLSSVMSPDSRREDICAVADTLTKMH